MDGFIAAIPANLPPWGVVTIFVLLVGTGRLIPRSTLEFIKTELRERIEDALLWKKVADERGKTIDELTKLLAEQTELAEVSAYALQSLRGARGGEDGEVDDESPGGSTTAPSHQQRSR